MTRFIKWLTLTFTVFALSGCISTSFETSYEDLPEIEDAKNWRVVNLQVDVPLTLSVSEANTYAPNADIVWREEPLGDRYEQVDNIITEAAEAGIVGLRGARPVTLVIVVSEFHALTQKARYGLSRAGVHNIAFTAQVFDANTGEALTDAEEIKADLIALTGNEALLAEAMGDTQRVRIVRHVSNVIAGWLGTSLDVREVHNRIGR